MALAKCLLAIGFVKELYEADNGKKAIEIAKSQSPDLIFMDYRMPEMNGYLASKRILKGKLKCKVKIILCTAYPTSAIILNCFRIGVKGVLSKNVSLIEITHATRAVMSGDTYLQAELDTDLCTKKALAMEIPRLDFSMRELQLIRFIASGMTNREIAEDTALSIRTVEAYRSNIIRKVKVQNTAELINYAYNNCIL